MVFECCVCGKGFLTPLRSLDRRVQSQTLSQVGDAVQVTLNIHQAETLLQYDSEACRVAHEPAVVAGLQLKTTYPPSGPVVPCGRCGAPVMRISPHVCYAWVTMEIDDTESLTGCCTEDTELAALCQQCESPGEGDAAREHAPRTRRRKRENA